jgi:hypothetical protein
MSPALTPTATLYGALDPVLEGYGTRLATKSPVFTAETGEMALADGVYTVTPTTAALGFRSVLEEDRHRYALT